MKSARIGFGAVTISVLFGLVFASYALRRNHEANPPERMQLDIMPYGSDWRVTWNPQARPVRRAERGVLWIEDGSGRQPLSLSAHQLLSGSVTVPRAGDDFNVRLEVLGGGVTFSGLARIVAAEQLPPPDSPAPAPAEAASADPVKVPEVRVSQPLPAAPIPLKVAPPQPGQTSAAEPLAPPAPVPAVSSSVSFQPVEPALSPGKQFRPARPARVREAALSTDAALRVNGEAIIEVKVYIGSDGQVFRTELMSKDADSLLAESAMTAARRGSFEPARLAGRAVESRMTAIFRFSRAH